MVWLCWSLVIVLAWFPWTWTGACLAQTAESGGQIWQVGDRRWDEAEETRFAAWVEAKVDEDFFIRHRIPVDCADVPYAIRWIYARNANLPAAATMVDGRLLGHWSTAWAKLPTHRDWWRDQRFRAALLYMLDGTSTRTLPADTYPIRINSSSVIAGAVTILPIDHSGIVSRIVLDGSTFSPVQTWEGTLPRKITKLRQRSYSSTWPDKENGSGLVRFRWPVNSGGRWHYLDRVAHPYYSEEQYRPEFGQPKELFDEAVAGRIDTTLYDPAERVRKIMVAIRRYLGERVILVQDGYRHCRGGNCPKGSYLWEMYSTPNRDAKIGFEIVRLLKIIAENGLDEATYRQAMAEASITIDEQQSISLEYVIDNYAWLSSNPEDSVAARWGLKKCDMIRERMRHALANLDFVEQRYRTTDPSYADYGRNLYLDDLRYLVQEGQRGSCQNLPDVPAEAMLLPMGETSGADYGF